MASEHNPLLAQVPLTVSPFIHLPKAPTLPHNYASLPSTLPPSILHSQASAVGPTKPRNETTPGGSPAAEELPAYVTSPSGFRAHPAHIIAQNRLLAETIAAAGTEAQRVVREWLEGIRERDLAEKRRKAPGWLDSEARILRPERVGEGEGEGTGEGGVGMGVEVGGALRGGGGEVNLGSYGEQQQQQQQQQQGEDREISDLGAQMDRAFG